MTQVVYADILFVINVYVTYLLLKLCDIVCRERGKRSRRVVAALCGGLYSLIIFIPSIPNYALVVSRLVFASALIFVAYGKLSRGRFFTLYGGFFLVNFVFAGLMFALWYFVAPSKMMFFGSVVYFDIDTLTLVVLTIICYGVMTAVQRLIKTKSPSDTLFELTVYLGEKCVRCNSFLDTGNSVFEPFSGYPVIIAQKEALGELLLPFEKDRSEDALALSLRYIPCISLGADDVLQGFRPDKIILKGAKTNIETNEVFIAMTDKAIKNGDYKALVNPAVFESRVSVQ